MDLVSVETWRLAGSLQRLKLEARIHSTPTDMSSVTSRSFLTLLTGSFERGYTVVRCRPTTLLVRDHTH
jgi:hypothetical protein